MKTKSLISAFLALATCLTLMDGAVSHADFASLTLLSPSTPQFLTPGETVQIKWSTALSPSLRQPVTVYLIWQKFKRIRIGSITQKRMDGTYSIDWKIPDRFFERYRFDPPVSDFRIEIRPDGGLRNRLISKTGLIRIQKAIPADIPDSGTPSTETPAPITDKPTTLSDRSTFVARYTFNSLYEPWVVKKLTAVNDADNDGFDPDLGEKTDVVDRLFVRYPDESGALKIATAPYTNGKATFSGLDFYIPSRKSAPLDLFVETIDPKIFGSQYSGKAYRMGIQDTSNGPSTFEAVGQLSGTTVNAPGSFQVTSASIEESVVNENVLDFAVSNANPQLLLNGDNDLFEFTVSSESARLGRLVFDVYQAGLTQLDNAKLFRNGYFVPLGNATQIGNAYLMWDSGPSSCFAQLAQGGAGTGMDCNGGTAPSSKLILTFSNEEIINGTTTYKLSLNASGADSGDTVTVRLNINDDFSKLAIPGSDTLNAKIHNGGLAPELFAAPADFASEATSITNRNIIWSDNSADLHRYTTLSPAPLPTSDTNSSADWTNGYLLRLNALPAITSKR